MYKSHHSLTTLTETFSQRIKVKLQSSSETMVAGGTMLVSVGGDGLCMVSLAFRVGH